MSARRPASQVERARVFGAHIRQLRRGRKLTQRQVAGQIPMSAGHLSRLESGDHGPPSDEVISRLATALDVDDSELLRLAGRDASGPSFERQVLSDLQQLRRELREGFARIERALDSKKPG